MPTNLSKQISDWSNEAGLPLWQKDLLRRIALGEVLTQADIMQYASLSFEENAPESALWFTLLTKNSNQNYPNLQPLKSEHFGVKAVTTKPICITEIKHDSGVNNLASNTTLRMAKNGLTVIFGINGAGKSGYTRILKQFAASRGIETVLPNALKPVGKISASIKFVCDNQEREEFWSGTDHQVNGPLQRVRVFDSLAAKIHLSSENELVYIPPQLQTLSSFVEILEKIKTELKNRVAELPPTPQQWNNEITPSFVELIKNLGTEKSRKAILSIERFDETQKAELEKLELHLKTLELTSPDKLATQANQRANQIKQMLSTMERTKILLSEDFIRDSIAATNEVKRGLRQVEQQAISLRDVDTLNIAGKSTWRKLWEIAQSFCEEHNLDERDKEHFEDIAFCPLCQQQLSDDAKNRFKQFRKFVTNETNMQLERAKHALQTRHETLNQLPLLSSEKIEQDKEFLKSFVDNNNKQLIDTLVFEFEQLWKILATQKETISAVFYQQNNAPKNSNVAKQIEDYEQEILQPIQDGLNLFCNIQQKLEKLISIEKSEAEMQLGLSATTAEQQSIRNQVFHLKELKLFSDNVTLLRNFHDVRLQEKCYLSAIKACDSKKVTNLNKKLSADYIQAISDNFAQELCRLNLDQSIPVRLSLAKSSKGVNYIQVTYNGVKTKNLANILSEGEQRIVSIAGFFADLTEAQDKSCLVFDDPVSSLDQRFRKSVATRLVDEVLERQVVVFTHDPTFVGLLEESLDDLNREHKSKGLNQLDEITEIEITRTSEGAGSIPEIEWRRRNLKKQIGQLKQCAQLLKVLEKTNPDQYTREAQNLIAGIRETWERVVEERLLNGVVTRFGRGVSTQRLRKISDITDNDIAKVEQGMTYCSRLMIGHADPLIISDSFPPASKIVNEVEHLDKFCQSIEKRRK